MGNPVARLGDKSNHSGTIISVASSAIVEGKRIAAVGDRHSCPIPGHGITAILTGSPKFETGGNKVARTTSVCGCGAVIIGGATKTVCA